MPRRRISRVSISSEYSTSSDQSDNLNINEELPDPGLPKTNCKEKAVKQNKAELEEVSSDFQFKEYKLDEKRQISPKTKDGSKSQRKPQFERASKKEAAKKAKEEKEAKKREIEAKREAVKKVIEDEKAAKAEFEENNKVYKPGECLKYITIELPPTLASAWYMVDTIREVNSMGARVSAADTILDSGLLIWTRRVPPVLTNDGGQVKVAPTKEQCRRALYIMLSDQLMSLADRIVPHMGEMRERARTTVTLLVIGPTTLCKNSRDAAHRMTRAYRDKFTKKIADIQIELLVSHKIDLIVVETPMELAMLVVHYTRAIAEAPYKKARRDIDEQAEFYMRGDNKNCVTVDKDGNGLSRLWEQMIAILPQSSLEVARTLGAEYKNPRALLQEFQSAGGIAKVADVGVARTNVPGAKTRRIGPEFARKLHTLFTTEDGNMVIE